MCHNWGGGGGGAGIFNEITVFPSDKMATVICKFSYGDICGYQRQSSNSLYKWELIPTRFLTQLSSSGMY